MIADSTTKVKYIAASNAAKEAIWINKFITELGVFPALMIQYSCTVITMELSHKKRSRGLIKGPNMYSIDIM